MGLLLEPPVEVVWAESAGVMAVVFEDCWESPGCAEPSWEMAELLAAQRPEPVGDWRVDWAVPGVPRLGDAEPSGYLPPPSREVVAYAEAVAGLERVDLAGVAPAQALADLAELLRVDELLRPVRLDRLTDAHTRKLAGLQDEVSVQTWARKRFDDVPREDIAMAGQLSAFPVLRAAVSGRRVSVEASRLVAKALRQLRRHVDRPDGLIDGQPATEVIPAVVGNVVPLVAAARMGLADDDPLLASLQTRIAAILTEPGSGSGSGSGSDLDRLEAAFTLMAQHIALRHLKAALAEQVDALLPSCLEADADRARQRRGLRLDPEQRRIQVRADDELYELTHTVLAAAARGDEQNPADTTAKRELRENPDFSGTELEGEEQVRFPRSREQRLHDALKLVLQRYLAAGLAGSRDKAPVAVTVTLPLEKLEKSAGALPAVGGSGRRLPASLVSRWWCDANNTGLVLSAGWIPLGQTHTQRTLTAAERRASQLQHGQACDGLRCCTPHDPLTTLVPHHVYSYATFGKTSMVETVWVCPRLHDAIHRGKTVLLRNGRWLNADGWADAPLNPDY